MKKMYCKAFYRHPCNVGGNFVETMPCCRECAEFERCEQRCNNSPELCNKSEFVEEKPPIEPKKAKPKKKVAQYDDAGNKIAVYQSVLEAIQAVHVAKSTMYTALGTGTKAGGYRWKYEIGE